MFSPISQWTTQPEIDGNAEPHFGALHQAVWNVLMKDLTQNPFAATFVDFESKWQMPSKLDDMVIQQRDSRFKANGHASPVDFCEDVVRKILEQIGKHHNFFDIHFCGELSDALANSRRLAGM